MDTKQKEKRKEYREKNKDKIAKQIKEYQLKHKEEIQKWKLENKEVIAAKSHEWYLSHKDDLSKRDKEWWNNFKADLFKDKECKLCHTTNDLVFHHIDPNTKETDVTRLKRKSKEIIQKEIDKCIVLCRSCHMKIHDPHKWRDS